MAVAHRNTGLAPGPATARRRGRDTLNTDIHVEERRWLKSHRGVTHRPRRMTARRSCGRSCIAPGSLPKSSEPATETPTVPLAAAALGVPASQIVKTVVLEGRREPCVAVAVVPGDRRVDVDKVSAVLRLPALRLARPDTVRRVTGFAVGGVPPIGHATPVAITVDRRVADHEVVYGGGGDHLHMWRIATAEILRVGGAELAAVSVSQG
jgi:prolyl-tRNA editing enzyme YbaK/EbsC (Cys-tRNA(Pro) deacylase)